MQYCKKFLSLVIFFYVKEYRAKYLMFYKIQNSYNSLLIKKAFTILCNNIIYE